MRQRNLVRKDKGLLAGLAQNGLHCSWDWDDVHFVNLQIYPADRQNPKVKYNAVWHDPQGGLTFLKQDLAAHVGASGRPVVVMSHTGFDSDWWHPEDWKAAYDAMRPYNVVLYLYGHSGTGVLSWAPPGETKPLTCVNTGQTENGFFVIQIVKDRLRVAYRAKSSIAKKSPDQKFPSDWEGKWEWKHLLDKDLSAPGPSPGS